MKFRAGDKIRTTFNLEAFYLVVEVLEKTIVLKSLQDNDIYKFNRREVESQAELIPVTPLEKAL